MIPEVPRLFGAAQDEARHAEMASTDGVLAAITQFGGNADAMIRAGVVAFAHLYDGYAAQAWIREAARLDADTIALMAPEAQRAEVERIWRAFGCYWQALNVSPYAWRRLRWAFEDALGYARSPLDRDTRFMRLDDPSRPAPAAEQRKHFRGIEWSRTEVLRGSGPPVSWALTNASCWTGGGGGCAVEGDMEVCRAGPDDGCVVGAWRAALHALPGAPQYDGYYIGRASEVRYEPGAAPLGVPNARSQLGNTGEVHRVWLWNDGTVRVDTAMRSDGPWRDRPWTQDHLLTTSADGAPRDDGGFWASAPGDFIPGYDWFGCIPPSRWYFDLLRAPQPGLKVRGAGPDVSLVDYLAAMSPEEIVREVRRDVMVRNVLMKSQQDPPILRDEDLFTRGQVEDFRRQETAQRDALGSEAPGQDTASAVMSTATTVAGRINPIAGVVVGAFEFLYKLGTALTTRSVSESRRYVDIFGRLMPTFERFEIASTRTVLVSTVAAMGLPPEVPPDPEVVRARREAAARAVGRVVDALRPVGDEGSRLLDPSLLRRGRRTVALVGLDPAQGARVYGTSPRERYETLPDGTRRTWTEAAPELTTGQPEYGGGAQWTTADGVPVWRFGVPEGVLEIRVAYPDGRERTIALEPPDPEGTPDARTAVVDAAPPTEAESGRAGLPARTVVLVGLDPSATPAVFAGTRMVALDPAPTGDAARWIDSTVPGVRGWMFGVPAGTRELRVLDALGARVFPLAPLGVDLPARDRVTVIDASRTSTQPLTAATTSKAPLVLGGLVALGLGALVLSRRSR